MQEIIAHHSLTARSYTPYGHVPGGADLLSSMGFKGERLELSINGYLLGNGYRNLSPTLMRFHCPDSESPFGLGGLNTYCFSLNDPINGSDPSGHFPFFTSFRNFTGKNIPINGFTGKVLFAKNPLNKSESILTINIHGNPGVVLNNKSRIKPQEFYDLFEQQGRSLKGRKIHLIACYSAKPAAPGQPSFARELSELTGAPVIGYKQNVSALPTYIGTDGQTNIRVLERATFFENLQGRRSARSIRVIEDAKNDIRTT